MLLESGDLFPVIEEAVDIPWTKRKNLIANFLYRGSVTFQTLGMSISKADLGIKFLNIFFSKSMIAMLGTLLLCQCTSILENGLY